MSDLLEKFEPEDGWYKQATEKNIETAILIMEDSDMKSDDIEEVLELIISSMMSEYGE